MNKTFANILRIVVLFALLATAVSFPTGKAAAAFDLPYGASITSATLTISIHVSYNSEMPINVYQVTQPWTEYGVTWNSFAQAFDPTPVATFFPGSGASATVDITNLVKAWKDGTVPNFGIMLAVPQADNTLTVFYSKEEPVSADPTLTICYDYLSENTCVQDVTSADTFIWEVNPDGNYGGEWDLWVGKLSLTTKESLLKFDITVSPPPYENPGTGTPGFWKNHPEAWPVDNIVIGGVTYTKTQAIAWLKKDNSEDKTVTMFRDLVAAKLNVLIDNDDTCIAGTITAADAWMATYGPVGSKVAASSDAWKLGEPLATTLDNYNNGLMCAPHRD